MADGDTITIQLLTGVIGYGAQFDVLTLIQTPQVDAMLANGLAILYTGPIIPTPAPTPAFIDVEQSFAALQAFPAGATGPGGAEFAEVGAVSVNLSNGAASTGTAPTFTNKVGQTGWQHQHFASGPVATGEAFRVPAADFAELPQFDIWCVYMIVQAVSGTGASEHRVDAVLNALPGVQIGATGSSPVTIDWSGKAAGYAQAVKMTPAPIVNAAGSSMSINEQRLTQNTSIDTISSTTDVMLIEMYLEPV